MLCRRPASLSWSSRPSVQPRSLMEGMVGAAAAGRVTVGTTVLAGCPGTSPGVPGGGARPRCYSHGWFLRLAGSALARDSAEARPGPSGATASARPSEVSASSAANSSDQPLKWRAGRRGERSVPSICSPVMAISAVSTNRTWSFIFVMVRPASSPGHHGGNHSYLRDIRDSAHAG